MKLTEEAQATLNELFAGNTEGNTVFNTTMIYNAGRSNGMKFRVIRETFMLDSIKVAYGKYDLKAFKEGGIIELSVTSASKPVAKKAVAKKAAKKSSTKPAPKKEAAETISLSKKEAKMIKDSANWEVVYDAKND